MGKFFNGKVKKDHSKLIKICLIIVGIILIILLIFLIGVKKRKNSAVVLEVKQTISVEINSDLPKGKDFFSKFKNYDEELVSVDYENLNINELGEYEVIVKAEGYGSQPVIVYVVDTTAPVLKLKEVKIKESGTYSIEDFIDSCEDNSNSECTIEYYDKSQDQDGNIIDYSSFVDNGIYQIKIIAKDDSGNITKVNETKLTIGDDTGESITPEPQPTVECKYGDLTPDSTKYPMAIIVGDTQNNCALNRDLWDDVQTQEPVSDFYMLDYAALHTDLQSTLRSKYPDGSTIYVTPHYIAILNKDAKGLVGYAIYVKVYIAPRNYANTKVDTDENLMLAYYIKSDRTRSYVVNKLNLK